MSRIRNTGHLPISVIEVSEDGLYVRFKIGRHPCETDSLWTRVTMAKVKFSSIITEIRGTLGDKVYRRCGDRIIVANKPKPSLIEPSEAQLANRERDLLLRRRPS